MEIRTAVRADLPQIRDIFNDVIATSNSVYSEVLTSLENRTEWFDAKMSAGFPFLVAVEADAVVAYGSYGHFRPAQGYRFTVEHTIHVRTDKRGLGLGKQLLERLIALAKEQGIHVMVGAFDSANVASLKLHEKYGFIEVARLPEIANRYGEWLTLVLMQKILTGD